MNLTIEVSRGPGSTLVEISDGQKVAEFAKGITEAVSVRHRSVGKEKWNGGGLVFWRWYTMQEHYKSEFMQAAIRAAKDILDPEGV